MRGTRGGLFSDFLFYFIFLCWRTKLGKGKDIRRSKDKHHRVLYHDDHVAGDGAMILAVVHVHRRGLTDTVQRCEPMGKVDLKCAFGYG